jgi:glycosyltransferase involved in cell wall biosynthesis
MAAKEHIHILMIDSEETWRGGEGQVSLLMRGLGEKGIRVSLAAPPRSAIGRRAEELGVPLLPLAIASGMDMRAVWTLRRYLRRGQFDVVHCHTSHAHGVAWMALGIARSASRDSRPTRPKLVVSRRVDFPVGRSGFGALKYRRGVDAFLAISKGVRNVLVECGVSEEKIEIVPSGIDLDKFNDLGETGYLESEFGLTGETTVIGNVAALAPHKSQADFIRAARIVSDEIPGARFFIVGEGELRPALETLVSRLGLGREVTLTGFRADVLAILSRFDCFVLSSYLEGLCTSIMDAHALGVPVVATRTGGVPELVDDGETGLLVPPREPALLAGAVVRMLRDEGLRSKCIRRAREQSRGYDYRRMVDQTVAAYQRLLG